MSRQFVHAFANDYVGFAAGNTTALDGGPQTSLMLWKADSVTDHGLLVARNGASGAVYEINPFSDNKIYWTSSGFTSTVTWASGVWYLFALTKANGSAAIRGHLYNYDTASWSHTDFGSIGDSTAGPVASMRAGWASSSDRLDGKIAAMALWGSVLSDGQLEGLTTHLSAWMVLSPLWCVRFNQASTATAVVDLTGGGGDQNDISGTSVSADEPAGWSYSLVTTVNLGLAVEADTAQLLRPLRSYPIGQVVEFDSALPLGDAAHNATSTATLTARRTSTPTAAAGRTSATAVAATRTSTSTVSDG